MNCSSNGSLFCLRCFEWGLPCPNLAVNTDFSSIIHPCTGNAFSFSATHIGLHPFFCSHILLAIQYISYQVHSLEWCRARIQLHNCCPCPRQYSIQCSLECLISDNDVLDIPKIQDPIVLPVQLKRLVRYSHFFSHKRDPKSNVSYSVSIISSLLITQPCSGIQEHL